MTGFQYSGLALYYIDPERNIQRRLPVQEILFLVRNRADHISSKRYIQRVLFIQLFLYLFFAQFLIAVAGTYIHFYPGIRCRNNRNCDITVAGFGIYFFETCIIER